MIDFIIGLLMLIVLLVAAAFMILITPFLIPIMFIIAIWAGVGLIIDAIN